LQSIDLLSNATRILADSAIANFKVNKDSLNDALDRNPILVTVLNSVIGYEKGAAIAKQAYTEKRSVLDVALEQTNLDPEQLKVLLDPARLTQGGVPDNS
jgi:fumarate hydratase class II